MPLLALFMGWIYAVVGVGWDGALVQGPALVDGLRAASTA